MCYLIADIEQSLTGRKLIQLTDLFPKPAQDFGLYRAQPFNAVMDLAFPGAADAMNPFEPVEHPPQGRTLSRLIELVWDGRVLACQGLTQATLRHSIHEQGAGHRQPSSLHAAGLFDKQRRDAEQRVFEQAKAALGLSLTFIGLDHRWIAELRCRKIGSDNKTGFVLRVVRNLCLSRPHLGWPLPVNGVDGGGGRRPPLAGSMLVFDQAVGFHLRVGPPFRQRSASRLCRLRRSNALGCQGKELCGDGGTFALLGFAATGYGTLQGRR